MLNLERVVTEYKHNSKLIERESSMGGCLSGEVFKVDLNGDTYKIRDCNVNPEKITIYKKYRLSKDYKINNAKLIPLWMRHLSDHGLEELVPKLLGVKDNILVIEWINGREFKTNESEQIIEKLGYNIGRIHQLPLPVWSFIQTLDSVDRSFQFNLEKILQHYPNLKSLETLYYRLKPRKLILGCVYGSLLTHNLMITEDNQIKFVDEENWKVDLPLGELVIPSTYWFSEGQRQAFFDGYLKSGIDPRTFNEQENFVVLFNLVKWLNRRLFFGKNENPDILRKFSFLEKLQTEKCTAA